MAGIDEISGGTVVSTAFESRSFAALGVIENYWDSVRKGRLVPNRFEVDPRGLSGALANAFVLERISGGLARFRIAGSLITEAAGSELRGVPISALFSAKSRDELADAINAVFEDPSIVRLKVSSPAGIGRPAIEGSLLLLPLRSDLGDITRILGGFEFDGDIGNAPRKLSIDAQARRGLTGFGGADVLSFSDPEMERRRPAIRNYETPVAHEDATVRSQNMRLSNGHLRLVVHND